MAKEHLDTLEWCELSVRFAWLVRLFFLSLVLDPWPRGLYIGEAITEESHHGRPHGSRIGVMTQRSSKSRYPI